MLGVEQAVSLAAAAAVQRPEILLPGVLRWLGRARRDVGAGLAAVRVLRPERFEHVPLTIGGFAAALGVEPVAAHGAVDVPGVLRHLRGVVPEALGRIPAPLGFHPRRRCAAGRVRRQQQQAGADPPTTRGKARALTPTSDADPR